MRVDLEIVRAGVFSERGDGRGASMPHDRASFDQARRVKALLRIR